MRKISAILLAIIVTLMATAVTVYASDESDEAGESEEDPVESGQAEEGSEEDGETDEKENTAPGFEFALAAAGVFVAARMAKIRLY